MKTGIGKIKVVVDTESWVNDNAFCCRVRTYELKRKLLLFNVWELQSDNCYATFEYYLTEKLNIYQDFIMEVSK